MRGSRVLVWSGARGASACARAKGGGRAAVDGASVAVSDARAACLVGGAMGKSPCGMWVDAAPFVLYHLYFGVVWQVFKHGLLKWAGSFHDRAQGGAIP